MADNDVVTEGQLKPWIDYMRSLIDSLGGGELSVGFVGAFETVNAPNPTLYAPGVYYWDLTSKRPFWSDGVSWLGYTGGGGVGSPTGVTAGTPGAFTPPGSFLPANLTQLTDWDPIPSPTDPWAVGQYVVLDDDSHAYWDGGEWLAGEAPPVPLTVGFTATPGTTFEPWVGLTGATDISWRNSSNVEIGTGIQPSFTVPVNGIINMVVDDESLVDFLNFGFDNTQDQGSDSLPATYNWPPTTLTGVTTPMTDIPNIRYFMAAETPLTGNLDISGHPHLEYIECYHAHVNTCDLSGCDALIRLCFETNDLLALDLTDVRLTLRDLRAADQGGVSPVNISCTGDLPVLAHYCVQGNAGGTDVPLNQMPALEEWWVWDKGMTTLPGGGLPTSERLNSIIAHDNPFSETTTDDFLIALAELALGITDTSNATINYNGAINIDSGITASAAATGAHALLLSRSWDLTDVATTGDATSDGVWPAHAQDGTADGWTRLGSSDPVAVYNDMLTAAWTGYSRVMRDAPDGTSEDEPVFEVTADRTSFTSTFWGMFCRADSSGNDGARVLLNGNTGAITGIGLSEGASTGNATVTTIGSVPAGWTNAGPHTVSMTLSGNQVTVALDGVDCYRATPSPSGGTYGGYYFGFCGTPGYKSRTWDSFTLT